MRRRKDPIPSGAEIYCADRASFGVFVFVMLLLPVLAVAAAVTMLHLGAAGWIVVGALAVVESLVCALAWLIGGGRTWIDGSRVNIRSAAGKTVEFSLEEITGYRFGSMQLRIYRGSEQLDVNLLSCPGGQRLRTLLRERGLQPQLLTPEEQAGCFSLKRNLRVEGDTLIWKSERILLSETELRQESTLNASIKPVLYRRDGTLLARVDNSEIRNADLFAWVLERNGIPVGDALPKL